MKIKDQSGIAHHLLLIAIAVVVVGAIAFAGYRVMNKGKIDAHADTWQQKPFIVKPLVKTNGKVVGGNYPLYEYDTLTKVATPSPMNKLGYVEYGNGSFSGYDYSTGDAFYIKSLNDSANKRVAWELKRAYRNGTAPTTLKSFPYSSFSEVKACVGANYIAYYTRGALVNGVAPEYNVYAMTKDGTQFRTVATTATIKAAGGDSYVSTISCGDYYFYVISGKKLLKLPYNNRVASTARLDVISGGYRTLPDVTAIYDLPEYNYGLCGIQYQTDSRIALIAPAAAKKIEVIDSNTKTVKAIDSAKLNATYQFCSLSPDGKFLANGYSLGVVNIDTNTKVGNLSTRTDDLPYGWDVVR